MKHSSLTVAGICLASAMATQAAANDACDANSPLTIVAATDDGTYDDIYGPQNAIDGNLDPSSRWSSESQGMPKSIVLNLGAEQTVKGLSIAWYKGDERRTKFWAEASADGEVWRTIIPQIQNTGSTLELEAYAISPVQAKFVRVTGNGNSANDWNSLTEVMVTGCGTNVAMPDQPVLTARPTPALETGARVLFDDSFADGDRGEGADPADANWWTTSSSSAIEISPGSLGLVSGGSGRGIRTTFDPQVLTDGQALQATFTFTTPATVGSNRDAALRIGIFDKLDRSRLEGDLSASTKEPNAIYDGLPGYMIDFDVNLDDASEANVDIRRHQEDTQGRLLGTTKGYQHLGGGGDPYQFEPNATYTGVMTLRKVASGIEIAGSLSQGDAVLSEYSTFDGGSEVNNFGMLAFHVNSKTFGSSKTRGEADNGLDFSNIKVEIVQ